MRTRLAVAAVVIALATTSCSTSRVAKSSTGATATVTTLAGPPVTEPATTSSTFGPPLIITAPPTTTTPKQALEAGIRAAAVRLDAAVWACSRTPAECDPTGFTTEPYTSFYRSYLAEQFVSLGRVRELDSKDPSYSVIGSVLVAEDGESAEYDVCSWNTEVIVQAMPDTERVVLNDLKTTIRQRFTLHRTEAGWLISTTATPSAKIVGRNDCGPRP
jgi:hypothetical protein